MVGTLLKTEESSARLPQSPSKPFLRWRPATSNCWNTNVCRNPNDEFPPKEHTTLPFPLPALSFSPLQGLPPMRVEPCVDQICPEPLLRLQIASAFPTIGQKGQTTPHPHCETNSKRPTKKYREKNLMLSFPGPTTLSEKSFRKSSIQLISDCWPPSVETAHPKPVSHRPSLFKNPGAKPTFTVGKQSGLHRIDETLPSKKTTKDPDPESAQASLEKFSHPFMGEHWCLLWGGSLAFSLWRATLQEKNVMRSSLGEIAEDPMCTFNGLGVFIPSLVSEVN